MNTYKDRIEKVTRYMEENLSRKMALDTLAEISFFSKYHFSRIFSAIVGMPPYAYLTQLRMNKSVEYLTTSDKSILEISSLCGFESVSNFNHIFKKHFNHTPSEVRSNPEFIRKIPSMEGNKPQESSIPSNYPEIRQQHSFLRRIWDMNISINELPDLEVAYVRHVGSYLETYLAWNKLGEWSARNQLFPPDQQFIGISLDDPVSTEEHECRYDACITIPKGFAQNGGPDIQYKTLPGGLYGLFQYYDTIDRFSLAYQNIYGSWLPESDFEPDERHCLEFCMNNPAEDPEGKAKVDLYIPIKKRIRITE